MAIDITTPDVAGDADLASWAAITRAAGFDAWVATPTSANLRALITDEVGTGGLYFVGGALGTPASVTLTNATGLPVSTGLTGLGTGVATALGVNVGSAGAPVLYNGALGTPSSATLTNATGLPISTGVSGLGTGIATFLATPSSANLRAAVTDESGSGALLFAGGALGTPASGVLTNCTGLPNASVVGLGTAALVADNTLVHLAGAETISGAKTFSTSPIITASLDMRNDIRMTDAGTNRWSIGRGAGGGGAADDWQLYNYSGAVALRVTYSGNVASFTNTPLVGSDPVMTRGATETVTGVKTFSANVMFDKTSARVIINKANAANEGVVLFQKGGTSHWIIGSGSYAGGDDFELYNYNTGALALSVDRSNSTVRMTNRNFFSEPGGIYPGRDHNRICGASSLRWSVVHAGTGSINTSDMREKTSFRAIGEVERDFARDVFLGAGWYQWLDAVADKGSAARQHIGLGAQNVERLAVDYGINPRECAFFCEDKLTELIPDDERQALAEASTEPVPMHRPKLDAEGNAMTRKGLRPDQLHTLGIAALFAELDTMRGELLAAQTRIAALEAAQ